MQVELGQQHALFLAAFVTGLALLGAAFAAYSSSKPGHSLDQVFSLNSQGIKVGLDDGIPGSPATAGDGKPDYANQADSALVALDSAKLGGQPPGAYQLASCLTSVSQAKGSNSYVSVPLPNACSGLQNGGACRIFVKFSKTNDIQVFAVNYYQNAAGAFLSSYTKAGGAPGYGQGTNGDTATENAMSLNIGGSGQTLIDDSASATALQLKNTNTAYDATVWVCS